MTTSELLDALEHECERTEVEIDVTPFLYVNHPDKREIYATTDTKLAALLDLLKNMPDKFAEIFEDAVTNEFWREQFAVKGNRNVRHQPAP